MSVTVDTPATSVQDRMALATRRLCDVLGLGALNPKELKHLSVALAEAGKRREIRENRKIAKTKATIRNIKEKQKNKKRRNSFL